MDDRVADHRHQRLDASKRQRAFRRSSLTLLARVTTLNHGSVIGLPEPTRTTHPRLTSSRIPAVNTSRSPAVTNGMRFADLRRARRCRGTTSEASSHWAFFAKSHGVLRTECPRRARGSIIRNPNRSDRRIVRVACRGIVPISRSQLLTQSVARMHRCYGRSHGRRHEALFAIDSWPSR
jgi:hypothetical protein